MKRPIRALLAAASVFALDPARSQSFDPLAITADAARRAAAVAAATPAAPWGCTVLLCLANPGGPTAIPECVAPIRRLWADLRRGRPFPSCPMATGPTGGVIARIGADPYDACPAGMAALDPGQTVESVGAAPRATSDGVLTPVAPGLPFTVGAAPGVGPGVIADPADAPPPPRVCAGRQIGTRMLSSGDGYQSVAIYDSLLLIQAAPSPGYVELLVDRGDGAGYRLWNRTRY
ncbi:MAG: hypothetical protein RJA99_3331 [Pseudomonadota bacterium]|jgi:hypothetical protein